MLYNTPLFDDAHVTYLHNDKFFHPKIQHLQQQIKSISLLGALVNKTHTYLNYMFLITTDKRTTVKPE